MATDFSAVEVLFSSVLDAAKDEMTPTGIEEVRHFLSVGEYGLALDTLADTYFEQKREASPVVQGLVEQIARQLSSDPAPYLQLLRWRASV